mgnify:CR=1 FL=1
MSYILIFLLLASPVCGQELDVDLLSVLGSDGGNQKSQQNNEPTDWGDIAPPPEPTLADGLDEAAKLLNTAFNEYLIILRNADTDEVNTEDGTAYRIWARQRDANGYRDKYSVMTNSARRLQQAMFGVDNQLHAVREGLKKELTDELFVKGQALEDYCRLTRLNTLLIVLEHWCSFRNVRFDKGYWRPFNSEEKPFAIRDTVGTKLLCARSFIAYPGSSSAFLDDAAKQFLQNPLPRELVLEIDRDLKETEDSIEALCRMEKELRNKALPDIEEMPKKLQFSHLKEAEFQRDVRAEYNDYIISQAFALAKMNEAVARMSLAATYREDYKEPSAWKRRGKPTEGCYELLPRFKRNCRWAHGATINYKDERTFHFSPASFGSARKAFPYEEAEFSQLQVALFQNPTD